MNQRPSSEQAHQALQSLLAAAFPSGHGLTAASIPYPTGPLANGTTASSSSTDGESRQTSGDGTPQEQQTRFMQTFDSLAASGDGAALHSHTMALLAAQPGLLPGLTFAPPSPGPRTRSNSVVPPTPQSQHASYYTPLPTRSGRVPQVPEPMTGASAEPARETMLFNDYFDWPSSDEDDPDFQPQAGGAGWGDIVIGQGGGVFSQDEEEDDEEYGTDFSAVDEGFTPGDLNGVQDGFSLAGLGSDDMLVGGIASTSRLPDAFPRPGPSSSSRSSAPTSLPSARLSAAAAASSSPAGSSPAFNPPLPPKPRATSASAAAAKGKGKAKAKAATPRKGRADASTASGTRLSLRKRGRTALSPLPEDPIEPGLAPSPPPPPPLPDRSSDLRVGPPSHVRRPAPAQLANPPAPNAPAPAEAPPDPAVVIDPAQPTSKTRKRKAETVEAEVKLNEAGKRVRGPGRKNQLLTPEEKEAINEAKKEKQRLTAAKTRERQKLKMKGFEARCGELEQENKELRNEARQLRMQLGLPYEASVSADGGSREQSRAPESVAEEEEEEEEEEEDDGDGQQQQRQPVQWARPVAPSQLGVPDVSKLPPGGAEQLLTLLLAMGVGVPPRS